MRGGILSAVGLDLDDPTSDAVDEELCTDQGPGDLVDVPLEQLDARRRSAVQAASRAEPSAATTRS